MKSLLKRLNLTTLDKVLLALDLGLVVGAAWTYHHAPVLAYWWAWMDWLERFPGPVSW